MESELLDPEAESIRMTAGDNTAYRWINSLTCRCMIAMDLLDIGGATLFALAVAVSVTILSISP